MNNNHFGLTLDTLAPTGSISRGDNQFHKVNFALTIVKGDATFMKVWFNSTAAGAKTDAGYTGGSWIAAAESYTTTFTDNGIWYYHLVLMDDVGNESEVYNTAVICYDTVAPVIPATGGVTIVNRDGTATELVKTRNVAIQFKASDDAPSSGLVSCAVSGDINTESTAWASALTADEISTLLAGNAVQRNIVLGGDGEEEATKTVSITVTDAAGNTSTAVSDTVVLDTKPLTGTIVLKDKTDTTVITNTWVNVADFILAITAADKSDWKGYKVWGDFNTDGGAASTSEPASYTDLTQAEEDAKRVALARKFTSGDSASKTVYAKIIDTAGNETTLESVIAKVDYTAPTVSVAIKDNAETRIKTHVSDVTGYTTQVLVPTVNAEIAGAASYQWYMDGTAYTGGSGTGAPTEFTIDSANMGAEGAKVFTLKVVDNAGNETTSTGVTVYVDKTAPSGSITMNAWYGGDAVAEGFHKFSTAGATASATDGPSTEGVAAGMKYMTCWCSQTAEDTTVVGTQIAYSANPTHAQINWDGSGESATNYIHIKYVDKVGNSAIVHSAAFGIDTTCDGEGAIAFTKEAYPSTSAQSVLTAPSSVSPINSFKVWGDITSAATETDAAWETFASAKGVTLTTGDGVKNINVRYRDTAGNVSTGTAATDSAELDTSTPSGTITLYVKDSTTEEKPAISNVAATDAHITCGESTEGKEFYQVYGDFTIGTTQAAQGLVYKACTLYLTGTAYAADVLVLYEGNVYKTASAITAEQNTGWDQMVAVAGAVVNTDYWKEYVNDTGVQYMNIATTCTSGDGTKNYHVRIMDNAGNISEEASDNFKYDTTAPVPTINDVDYNRISKVHTKRLQNASGTISELTTYNDETKFNTTCDSVFVEYKIVAYVSQAAAEAGSHEDAAVPTTAGSVNMSGTGTWGPGQAATQVDHTIKGADYESALIAKYNTSAMTQAEAEALGFTFEDGEVNGIDGLHYVVVYVKDQGGTWSVVADFSA